MKRIMLFVMTNIAVMVVVGIVTSLLGVGRYTGTNTGQLMCFRWWSAFPAPSCRC